MRAITQTTIAATATAKPMPMIRTNPPPSASEIQSRISPANGAMPTTIAETASAGMKRFMRGGSLDRPAISH